MTYIAFLSLSRLHKACSAHWGNLNKLVLVIAIDSDVDVADMDPNTLVKVYGIDPDKLVPTAVRRRSATASRRRAGAPRSDFNEFAFTEPMPISALGAFLHHIVDGNDDSLRTVRAATANAIVVTDGSPQPVGPRLEPHKAESPQEVAVVDYARKRRDLDIKFEAQRRLKAA